jgi:hypothetical protein
VDLLVPADLIGYIIPRFEAPQKLGASIVQSVGLGLLAQGNSRYPEKGK